MCSIVFGCGGGASSSTSSSGGSNTSSIPSINTLQWHSAIQSSGAPNLGSAPGDVAAGVAATSDGGVVAVGYSLGSFIGAPNSLQVAAATVHRLDATGKVIWTRNILSGSGDFGVSVVVAPDGTIVMASTRIESSSLTSAILTAFSSAGTQIWQTRYVINGAKTESTKVVLRGSSELLLLGSFTNGTGQNMFLNSVNLQDGSLLSTKSWGDASSLLAPVDISVRTSSGELGVVGQTLTTFPSGTSGATHSFVLDLDASGNQRWVHEFTATSTTPEALSVAFLTNGDLLAGGVISSDSPPIFVSGLGTTTHSHSGLWRLNGADGSIVSTKEFYSGAGDQVSSLTVSGDGSIYLVGSTNAAFNSGFTALQNCFLIKLDQNANPIWVQQFGSGDVVGKTVPYGVAVTAGASAVFTSTTIQAPLGSSQANSTLNTSWLISGWGL